MMGVTRSFAGPLRVSDLLAMEMAKGAVPSTPELIDMAIGWSQPMLLTKPELLSFVSGELSPLVEKLQGSRLISRLLQGLAEKIPPALYQPIKGMATFANLMKSPLPKGVKSSAATAFFESPEIEGLYLLSSRYEPYIVYNPGNIRLQTFPHEMYHHWYSNPYFIDPYEHLQAFEFLKRVSPRRVSDILELDIRSYPPEELVRELWTELSARRTLQEAGIPLPRSGKIEEVFPSEFLKLWETYHQQILK